MDRPEAASFPVVHEEGIEQLRIDPAGPRQAGIAAPPEQPPHQRDRHQREEPGGAEEVEGHGIRCSVFSVQDPQEAILLGRAPRMDRRALDPP